MIIYLVIMLLLLWFLVTLRHFSDIVALKLMTYC